ESYVLRELELEHAATRERRRLVQLHYVAWPDRGVPRDREAFLEMRALVHTLQCTLAPVEVEAAAAALPPAPPPLLVHCSAGVGRTGVFCVLDAELERLREEALARQRDAAAATPALVDMPRAVLACRAARPGAVQTAEQYAFCYRALLAGAASLGNGAAPLSHDALDALFAPASAG